jgi:nucleotide-binding universal stress UspA family protein
MDSSILVAVDDTASSRTMVDYLISLPLRREDVHITLLHVFKKPSASVELMGERFTEQEPKRFLDVLQRAKNKLVENGFNPHKLEINMVSTLYPTVTDGIIDQLEKGDFDMAVIGRKKMSKAEEFVLGDISIKLVRSLKKGAILVVESP